MLDINMLIFNLEEVQVVEHLLFQISKGHREGTVYYLETKV